MCWRFMEPRTPSSGEQLRADEGVRPSTNKKAGTQEQSRL